MRVAKMDGKLDDKAERPCGCLEDSEGVRDGDGGFITEDQKECDGSGNGGGGYTSGNPQHEISPAKGGTTLGQSRSKLEESPPHDFGLQQQVQHPGGCGQWNGSQEARKHNENSDVQEAQELQDKLRDFNVL